VAFIAWAGGNAIGSQIFQSKWAPRYIPTLYVHLGIYAAFICNLAAIRILLVYRNHKKEKAVAGQSQGHLRAFEDLSELLAYRISNCWADGIQPIFIIPNLDVGLLTEAFTTIADILQTLFERRNLGCLVSKFVAVCIVFEARLVWIVLGRRSCCFLKSRVWTQMKCHRISADIMTVQHV
jgi:hypothetical protein